MPEEAKHSTKTQNDGSGLAKSIFARAVRGVTAHILIPVARCDLTRMIRADVRIAREFINQRRAPDRQHRTIRHVPRRRIGKPVLRLFGVVGNMSIVTALNPSCRATSATVPAPPNGSRTVSSALVQEARIIGRTRLGGKVAV